ncbi:MAG: hypothetical protein TE42_07995 [Candidatus Synechococcus spongiarum SP3]|uniref:Uncharacterized protein n=1 Tax=Candidatus Synechococcus spongiarum SP3 TaxID=1604020 RepID=A0A0G2IVU7_9SYNE|nr:MAG: hypothetical protein TE42_07995 [Candidatus Synechococcus spongiarum SP3]
MSPFLASLLSALTPYVLAVLGLTLLWQRVSHLRDEVKELRNDLKEGFDRMERRLDKQQDLILALTNPSIHPPVAKQ